MTTEVLRNDAAKRYEIREDGVAAGALSFLVHEGRLVLDHTGIEEAFAGRGIASVLVRAALDDIRSNGWQIVPLCPYVTGWLGKHPEYADLVDSALLQELTGGIEI